MEGKLVLIDGNSLINRAYFSMPPLSTRKGETVNAVLGFTNMLIRLITDEKPDYLAVCFDLPAPTFRHQMYSAYKQNRKKMPDDLASQLPLLKKLLHAMNISVLELSGYEADDIIGTMSKKFSISKLIVTGDRDCLQLIDDDNTVCLTKFGLSELIKYDRSLLMSDYGLLPEQVIDFKSLMGDPSDNIPGVPGIGEKTALKLIAEYSTLENVLANKSAILGAVGKKLTDGEELARMSYSLATIDLNVPISVELEKMRLIFPFREPVKQAFLELGFNSLIKRKIYADNAVETVVVPKNDKHAALSDGDMPAQIQINSHTYNTIEVKTEKDIANIFVSKELAVSMRPLSVCDGETVYTFSAELTLLDNIIDEYEALKILLPVFSDKTVIKYVFDYKEWLYKLEPSGASFNNAFDIMLAQYLVDSSVKNTDEQSLLDNFALSGSGGILDMGRYLKQQIKAFDRLYYEIEFPLARVLYDMERCGFRIDCDVLNELSEKYRASSDQLAEKIYQEAGVRFNINSPKQLGEVLFDRLKLPHGKKTKTGYSTNAEVLSSLKGEKIVDYIQEYRSVMKMLGTYIDGFKKVLGPDNYVHTIFRQALTTTGRLSSTEPNLQNIPIRTESGREIRRMFVASPGNILISADYSQIELRLLAHFSGETALIDAFNNNEDFHTRTASEVFGVEKESVTKDMRRAAKAVNFGIIYGISDWGLAGDLGIPVSQAKLYIQKYFMIYPKVKEFLTGCERAAKSTGYAETLTGRRRPLPEIYSKNAQLRAFGERAAMNMPLQGTAADLIKIAMINVADRIKREGLNSRLILSVHDELVIDAVVEEADAAERILVEEMENALKLSVKLSVETGRGYRLYDIK